MLREDLPLWKRGIEGDFCVKHALAFTFAGRN